MKKLLTFFMLLALPAGATELSDRVRIPEFRRDTGKPIYVASLAPMASMPALFQIIPGGGGGGSALTPGTTTFATCTANAIFYNDASNVFQCNGPTYDNSGALAGAFAFAKSPSGGATTSNFFNITGTMPTTLTAAFYGQNIQITGAGSSSQNVNALRVDLIAGYTGNVANAAIATTNASATGGNNLLSTASAALDALNTAAGSGDRVGVRGWTSGNTTGQTVGVVGHSASGSTRVGVAGMAATGGATADVGVFGGLMAADPTFATAAGLFDNGSASSPILIVRDNGATTSTAASWAGIQVLDGGQPQNGLGVLTSSTATVTNAGEVRSVISRYDITNAMVTALGAVGAGDVQIATLPAKTIVKNAYIVIDTPDTSANALTIAFGRAGATYIDYIVASDAKGAANTVYGDASGERGTNLTGYDLPSYTATTGVFCHFIKTTTNLNTVTGFTAHVIIETTLAP